MTSALEVIKTLHLRMSAQLLCTCTTVLAENCS